MARISAKIGDEIFVEDEGRIYEIKSVGHIGLGLVRANMCASCHRNPGDDFPTPFGNLCAGCVNTAMELYAANLAINHLIENDEEFVEVMHIMERYDDANNHPGVQHVDFHSSVIDLMWGFSDDDWMQFSMSLSASIRQVYESRTLLNRA